MTIYFDDIRAGHEVITARRTVTEADILWFCGISGDFNPLHTDLEFIREHTPFRDRIAHGHLVLSITGGLRSELDNWRIVAYLDCQRRFLAPVYAQDTIHGEYTVTEVRPSKSRPDTGVVVCDVKTVNQAGEVVHQGTDVLLIGVRPNEDAGADASGR
jgi:3-hydroxybutyryl-CoA dehydratase